MVDILNFVEAYFFGFLETYWIVYSFVLLLFGIPHFFSFFPSTWLDNRVRKNTKYKWLFWLSAFPLSLLAWVKHLLVRIAQKIKRYDRKLNGVDEPSTISQTCRRIIYLIADFSMLAVLLFAMYWAMELLIPDTLVEIKAWINNLNGLNIDFNGLLSIITSIFIPKALNGWIFLGIVIWSSICALCNLYIPAKNNIMPFSEEYCEKTSSESSIRQWASSKMLKNIMSVSLLVTLCEELFGLISPWLNISWHDPSEIYTKTIACISLFFIIEFIGFAVILLLWFVFNVKIYKQPKEQLNSVDLSIINKIQVGFEIALFYGMIIALFSSIEAFINISYSNTLSSFIWVLPVIFLLLWLSPGDYNISSLATFEFAGLGCFILCPIIIETANQFIADGADNSLLSDLFVIFFLITFNGLLGLWGTIWRIDKHSSEVNRFAIFLAIIFSGGSSSLISWLAASVCENFVITTGDTSYIKYALYIVIILAIFIEFVNTRIRKARDSAIPGYDPCNDSCICHN